MIISVADFKELVDTDKSDEVLILKLSAIETMIRSATNNNFQKRSYRSYADIVDGNLVIDEPRFFAISDTLQISQSKYNDGIVTLMDDDGSTDKPLIDEVGILVTKVVYPADVVMGAVNLCKWDLENRDKIGVKSESISRWNVTYFDLDANHKLGFPTSLVGFMKPYIKARF